MPDPARSPQNPTKTLDVPHFVGIGAPRCGTTWVYKMLRLHPQVWIPWKEIHYFDSVDPGTPSGFDVESRGFRLRHGWRYLARRLAVRSLPGSSAFARRFMPLRAFQVPGYRWSARYLFGDASLDWYRSLFREGMQRNLICGEVTPAYFMLSEAGIERFVRALPLARSFLLLRNPVEWAWSSLCMDLRIANIDPASLADAELIARCPVPNGNSRADFGSNLRRWMAHCPRERLMIDFYDEIRSDPLALLDRLCAFIGIAPAAAPVRRLAGERINSSAQGRPMPRAVERYAAERFHGEAKALAELVGGPATRWLDQIEAILRGH